MSRGIYLFCLTPGSPLQDIALRGMDEDHPLLSVAIADFSAVVSEVALEDFTGQNANERLGDVVWVAPRAIRHENVILAIMDRTTVLPVRFGSVFSSLEVLVSSLQGQRDAYMDFFRTAAGKSEWTLKAFVDTSQARPAFLAARLQAAKEQLDSLSPGMRYFQEQKIKTAVNGEIRLWLSGLSGQMTEFVRELTPDFRERACQSKELTQRDDEMFFHAAILVPDSDRQTLFDRVDAWNGDHASSGLQLELSGPLPPYHFTPVPDSQE